MQSTDSHRATQAQAVLEPIVPEPTADFVEALRSRRPAATPTVAALPIPIPMPIPFPLFGSRFLIWKQDPAVQALGRRLTYISGLVLNGPRDARIDTVLPGTTPVARNVVGDFIFHVEDTPQADCAHTFAVVRQTLTMYERLRGGTPIPWAWNTGGNTDVLSVFPRAGVTPNAFYSRGQKSLKFFFFTPSGATSPVFTCRSLDIVAHETGHAILDGLKPGWLGFGNPPQTGGLHESFGDLSALFLALSQLDQVEAFIAMTRANLHAKNFLAALAEQFGGALGQTMGLRNADNDLRLSQVSNEVHAISQVFTGAVYDIMADIFAYERHRQRATRDPAQVLLEVAQNLAGLLLQAIIASPAVGATYADVANAMLQASHAQGDPPIYRTFIRNRFTVREIVVSPTPLAMTRGMIDFDDPGFVDGEDSLELDAALPEHASIVAPQDRSGCCGTMLLPEYYQDEDVLEKQRGALTKAGHTLSPEQLLTAEIRDLARQFK